MYIMNIEFKNKLVKKLVGFLSKYRQRLENKRCLYVIKPNNPKNVWKFGIAGFSQYSKIDSYSRLNITLLIMV